jgi:type II secretory pathway component PulK
MNNKGVALLLALLTLLIISLLVVAFLETTTIDLQIVSNQLNRNKALYTADAGVEYAVYRLKGSKANFTQLMQFPSGSGNTYSVTYVSSSGIITSTGTLASGESVTLEAKVSVTGSSPFTVKILYWREI